MSVSTFIQYLWLDGQQDHLRAFGCLTIIACRRDSIGPLEVRASGLNDIGSDELSRRELPAIQQTGQNSLCHISCADQSDSLAYEHRAIILIALQALQLASADARCTECGNDRSLS